MYAPFRNLIFAIALAIGGMSTGFAGSLRTVALTGDAAPGTNQNFGFLDSTSAVINNLGQVVFRHSGTTPVGVWSERSGNLAPVLLRGDSTPGLEGDSFYRASGVNLNDAGQTAFFAVLNSSTGIDSIWSEGPGSLTLMAHEGDPVLAPNEDSAFGGVGSFRLNQNGQTAIYTGLSGPGRNSGDRGIWLDTNGTRQTIAVTGQQAPGLSSSTFISIGEPSLNSSGTVAFHALLDSHPDGSIWVGKNGTLEMIVREDDLTPGVGAGRIFGGPFGNGSAFFEQISINSGGDVAFSAVSKAADNLWEPGFGIWAGSKDSLRLVAHDGGYATNPSRNIDLIDVSDPLLNAAGDVAFSARFHDENGNDTTGIWSEAFGGLATVVVQGQAVEGLDGFVFGNLNHQVPSGLAFNSEGQIAFAASLSNATTGESEIGIFAQDADGELQLIANTGGQLEVSPGNFQTIQELQFAGGAGDDDGRSSGFNDLGQVAFYAAWNDQGGPFSNKTGIFVSNLAASSLPGDFDLDNDVDGSDFLSWQRGAHSAADLAAWQTNYGSSLLPASSTSVASAAAVPEPTTLGILGSMAVIFCLTGRFSARRRSA